MKDESGKLILNVDDDLARNNANSRLLLENGYEIIQTSDTADVIRLAVEKKPAVILLHVNILEIIPQIKSEPSLKRTFVLQLLDAASNAAVTGDAFLKEPYSSEELTAQVRILLRLRQILRKTSSQQDLIQNVTKAVPTVCYIYNIATPRIEYLTNYAMEILGYVPGKIQEFNQSFIERLMHPDDLSKVAAHFQKLRSASDGEILKTEFRMRHKSGEQLWFESRDRVMNRTPDGLPERIFGIASDVKLRDGNSRLCSWQNSGI
jgi:PAS domain S-box-containing protein